MFVGVLLRSIQTAFHGYIGSGCGQERATDREAMTDKKKERANPNVSTRNRMFRDILVDFILRIAFIMCDLVVIITASRTN